MAINRAINDIKGTSIRHFSFLFGSGMTFTEVDSEIPPTPFDKGGRGDFVPYRMAQRAITVFF
jgi:hypothetical protein